MKTMNIIDQNEILKKYSYNNILTENDSQKAISIIDSMIDEKNYFTTEIVFSSKNVVYCNGLPSYQTKEDLLQRSESIWYKFKSTFLLSALAYINKEIEFIQYSAWGFMTNNTIASNRDKYWHHHHFRKENEKMISGIYYLRFPENNDNLDLCGTEFSLQGKDFSNTVFVKPSFYNWLIHPSNLYHRPGIWNGSSYRYVLAADLVYKEIK